MPTYSTLRFQREEGVATIVLSRPEAKNALSRQMAVELLDCLSLVRADEKVRAVILTGAGGNFCSGGDLRGVGSTDARTADERLSGMELYRRLCIELFELDRPVIAAVDGVAYGAGFSMALLCDLIVVSHSARLCMVFHRAGRIPDMGALYTLPRAIGLHRAKELVFSAREIDAGEAVQMGLAIASVESSALLPYAEQRACALADGPIAALRISKRALNEAFNTGLGAVMQIEASGQAVATASDFAREASRRFLAKEAAQFQWPSKI